MKNKQYEAFKAGFILAMESENINRTAIDLSTHYASFIKDQTDKKLKHNCGKKGKHIKAIEAATGDEVVFRSVVEAMRFFGVDKTSNTSFDINNINKGVRFNGACKGWSLETIEVDSNEGAIQVVDPQGNIEIYNTKEEAVEKLGYKTIESMNYALITGEITKGKRAGYRFQEIK